MEAAAAFQSPRENVRRAVSQRGDMRTDRAVPTKSAAAAVARRADDPTSEPSAPPAPQEPGFPRSMPAPSDDTAWHGTTILSRAQGRQGGDRRRRPGDDGPDRGQVATPRSCAGSATARSSPGFAGATADAFTLFERLEAKLEQHPGQLAARLRRAGQGLAHRPLSAPARGDDGGRRQERLADPVRHRRRARARGRPHRHRLGRRLCAGGGARAHRPARSRRRGDRAQGDGDRRRDLHLHQRQGHLESCL